MPGDVFYPTEIPDAPFPQADQQVQSSNQSSSVGGSVVSPPNVQDQNFPTVRHAVDLIGNIINTKARKILQDIGFSPSGAIQIGQFQNGVSGDIRISKDGIVGRNEAGETTFAIDGDSGDAIFQGTIQGQNVLSGQVIVGDDAIQIDGENKRMVFYDANSIPTIVIGIVS